MQRINKHSFEAVSLLTADNGMIDITIIPAVNQPDWLLPSALILETVNFKERIWTYLWQQQEVAVFHLIPQEQQPNLLVVLEGNTDVHRIGLQTFGHLTRFKANISDIKDVDTSLLYQYMDSHDMDASLLTEQQPTRNGQETNAEKDVANKEDHNEFSYLNEGNLNSFLFQAVQYQDAVYIIPDIDKIAHNLVDLDS